MDFKKEDWANSWRKRGLSMATSHDGCALPPVRGSNASEYNLLETTGGSYVLMTADWGTPPSRILTIRLPQSQQRHTYLLESSPGSLANPPSVSSWLSQPMALVWWSGESVWLGPNIPTQLLHSISQPILPTRVAVRIKWGRNCVHQNKVAVLWSWWAETQQV